jgi:hypothetical protein
MIANSLEQSHSLTCWCSAGNGTSYPIPRLSPHNGRFFPFLQRPPAPRAPASHPYRSSHNLLSPILGNIATTSGYLHARPESSSGLKLDPGVWLR